MVASSTYRKGVHEYGTEETSQTPGLSSLRIEIEGGAVARKRAQQFTEEQERRKRKRYYRRRQLILAAKRRKKAVKYYRSLKQSGYTERQAAQQAAEKFQTSLSSIRRWEKLDREWGYRALMDESRRPHTIHFQISLEVKLLVVVIRTLLSWGERRISAELKRLKIATISVVYEVNH